jgi:carbonic anhydrase
VAIVIKGFDQITASMAGVFISGAFFATLWYGGKYLANQELEQEEKLVAKAEKELKTLENSKAGSTLGHTVSTKIHKSVDPSSSLETTEYWGYLGQMAPWNWGNLRPEYANCSSKTDQSPIDISGARLDESLKALKLNYFHGVTALTFHHSTVQGRIENGSWIDWDGERFDLKEVRFRTPSEHRTNGLPWEMEIHLVHEAITRAKLILAVFVTLGKTQPFLENIAHNAPRIKDEVRDVEKLNWSEILPQKRTYWSYTGSDTVPPCDAHVRWIVMTEPLHASKSSIDRFVGMQKNNVRPVFPLGKRPLGKSNR